MMCYEQKESLNPILSQPLLDFSVNGNLLGYSHEVSYEQNYPSFSVVDDSEKAMLTPLLTKSKEWEYECEYRLFSSNNPCHFGEGETCINNFLKIPESSLSAIIMGINIKDESRREIEKLVEGSSQLGWDIKLKQAVKSKSEYKMLIEDL